MTIGMKVVTIIMIKAIMSIVIATATAISMLMTTLMKITWEIYIMTLIVKEKLVSMLISKAVLIEILMEILI